MFCPFPLLLNFPTFSILCCRIGFCKGMTRSISLIFGRTLVNIVLLVYENFEPSRADGSGDTWGKVFLISAGWLRSKSGVSVEVLEEKGDKSGNSFTRNRYKGLSLL